MLAALYTVSANVRWPGRKSAWGETQGLRGGVTRFAVLHFLLSPAEEQRALLVEEPLQIRRVEALIEQGLALANDIEVHQRQVDFRQP